MPKHIPSERRLNGPLIHESNSQLKRDVSPLVRILVWSWIAKRRPEIWVYRSRKLSGVCSPIDAKQEGYESDVERSKKASDHDQHNRARKQGRDKECDQHCRYQNTHIQQTTEFVTYRARSQHVLIIFRASGESTMPPAKDAASTRTINRGRKSRVRTIVGKDQAGYDHFGCDSGAAKTGDRVTKTGSSCHSRPYHIPPSLPSCLCPLIFRKLRSRSSWPKPCGVAAEIVAVDLFVVGLPRVNYLCRRRIGQQRRAYDISASPTRFRRTAKPRPRPSTNAKLVRQAQRCVPGNSS